MKAFFLKSLKKIKNTGSKILEFDPNLKKVKVLEPIKDKTIEFPPIRKPEPIVPKKIPMIKFERIGKPESLTKSALFFSVGIIFVIFIFRKLKSRKKKKNNKKNV